MFSVTMSLIFVLAILLKHVSDVLSCSTHPECSYTLQDLLPSNPVVADLKTKPVDKVNGENILQLAAAIHGNMDKGFTGNAVTSPLSIYIALANLALGARSLTLRELESALGINAGNETEFHKLVHTWISTLTKSNVDSTKVALANRLFISNKRQIKEDYKQKLQRFYSSSIGKVSFENSKESANAINNWVEEHTNDLVEDLISPTMINSFTVSVLVNAIYFTAKWQKTFPQKSTHSEKFFVSKNNVKNVDMMKLKHFFRLINDTTSQSQILLMPFRKTEDFQFLVILPKDGGKLSLEKCFVSLIASNGNSTRLAELVVNEGRARPIFVDLILPKFKLSSQLNLVKILRKIGITKPFDSNAADFKDMGKNIYVSDMVHKAIFTVDESGLEAVGATASMTGYRSVEPLSIPFVVNRPFIGILWSNKLNLPLFLSFINDPSEGA